MKDIGFQVTSIMGAFPPSLFQHLLPRNWSGFLLTGDQLHGPVDQFFPLYPAVLFSFLVEDSPPYFAQKAVIGIIYIHILLDVSFRKTLCILRANMPVALHKKVICRFHIALFHNMPFGPWKLFRIRIESLHDGLGTLLNFLFLLRMLP